MSSLLFDAGDMQRLDRERTLIEQRERIPAEEDGSPVEDPIRDEPGNDVDIILDALALILQRRLE